MGTELFEKLKCLRRLDDLALFRWASKSKRIDGKFIPLSELRLNVLACSNGVVRFCSAAPVLRLSHGRPKITLHDADVFRVLTGDRRGINILNGFITDSEQVAEAPSVMHMSCSDDCECPAAVAHGVMSMGHSLSYPVIRATFPDMFRLTSDVKLLRPVYTKQVLEVIGGKREDGADELKRKFAEHIELFGYKSDAGYVVNSEYVAAGGMLCVSGEGISRKSGGPVFQIPLSLLKTQATAAGWVLHLEEEQK